MPYSLPFSQARIPVEGTKLLSRQGQRPTRRAWHNGIDLSGTLDQDIFPIADGTVESVCLYPTNCCGGYGNTVLVRHGDDLLSFYAHMHRVDVVEGQAVTTDTPLGGVGKTFAAFRERGCPARSMVKHLHLEIRHDDGSRYDVLGVLAAAGVGLDRRAYLTSTEAFEYAEPALARNKTDEVEEIMPPSLRYGKWLTVGVPVVLITGAATGIYFLLKGKR